VNVVTVDDIQRVARDYLMPDRLSMVLVGDADTFVDDLPNIGLQVFERVALSELDLMTTSLILNGPFEQTSDVLEFPGSQQEYALSIIDRAIKVKGGIDRLKSVQTVTAFGNMTMFTSTGPVDAETVVYLAYPEQFRVETDLPTGQVIQAYNSGDAWLQSIEGVREAPQSLRNDFQASLRRDLIPLLLRAASGELDIRLTTSANSDSFEPLAVEISSEDIAPVNIYLDPKTGLVMRQTYRTEGEDGMQETEELYSDYRDVDGVLVAFRSIVRRNGFSVLERQLTKLSFNETLSQELFTKPAEQR
jgi:zinc protease